MKLDVPEWDEGAEDEETFMSDIKILLVED